MSYKKNITNLLRSLWCLWVVGSHKEGGGQVRGQWSEHNQQLFCVKLISVHQLKWQVSYKKNITNSLHNQWYVWFVGSHKGEGGQVKGQWSEHNRQLFCVKLISVRQLKWQVSYKKNITNLLRSLLCLWVVGTHKGGGRGQVRGRKSSGQSMISNYFVSIILTFVCQLRLLVSYKNTNLLHNLWYVIVVGSHKGGGRGQVRGRKSSG